MYDTYTMQLLYTSYDLSDDLLNHQKLAGWPGGNVGLSVQDPLLEVVGEVTLLKQLVQAMLPLVGIDQPHHLV